MELNKRQIAFLDAYMENPMISMKAHAERLNMGDLYKLVLQIVMQKLLKAASLP